MRQILILIYSDFLFLVFLIKIMKIKIAKCYFFLISLKIQKYVVNIFFSKIKQNIYFHFENLIFYLSINL